jgi:hypothetical protein
MRADGCPIHIYVPSPTLYSFRNIEVATMIRTIVFAFALCTMAGAQIAHANATCQSTVTDKKLYGAARASFLKKCQADAQAKCDAAAGDRKLAGAPKTSFTKKCVNDATGA